MLACLGWWRTSASNSSKQPSTSATPRRPTAWLTERTGGGLARVIGATVREQAGRWWVSFQIEVDRADINTRRAVAVDAPTCGIDLGLKTFAMIVDDDGTVTEIHAPRALKAA